MNNNSSTHDLHATKADTTTTIPNFTNAKIAGKKRARTTINRANEKNESNKK